MRRIRVLMITPDYPPDILGGIGTYASELVSRLSTQECEITVLVARRLRSTSEPETFTIKQYSNTVTVVTFPTDWNRDFGSDMNLPFRDKKSSYGFTVAEYNRQLLLPIVNYIRTVKPFDVLHAQDTHHPLVVIALKDLFQLPLAVTIHALAVGPEHFLDSLRRYLLYNADAAIAVSAYLQKKIEARYGVLPSPVEIIHNGVTCSSQEVSLERATHPGKSPHSITFCGRLVATKGCTVLLNAFHLLCVHHENLPCTLRIIGDGPLLETLQEQSRVLNIHHAVEFLGYQSAQAVREILRTSSLHIVPSLEEPFGIVALEAMAEGTPVITTSAGGLQEIVQDGWNGDIVPPDDARALAHAMRLLLGDELRRVTYASHGIETVTCDFSWERAAHATRHIYETAITRFQACATGTTR